MNSVVYFYASRWWPSFLYHLTLGYSYILHGRGTRAAWPTSAVNAALSMTGDLFQRLLIYLHDMVSRRRPIVCNFSNSRIGLVTATDELSLDVSGSC